MKPDKPNDDLRQKNHPIRVVFCIKPGRGISFEIITNQ